MENFRQSRNKLQYAYLLTPGVVVEKSKLTAEFLRRKGAAYEVLQTASESLKVKVNSSKGGSQ